MWIDPKTFLKYALRQALMALIIPCAFIAYTVLCVYIGRISG